MDEETADELAGAVVTLLEGWIDLKVGLKITELKLQALGPEAAREAQQAITETAAAPIQATRDLLRRTLRTAFVGAPPDDADGGGPETE
jgi:hypothetical protein